MSISIFLPVRKGSVRIRKKNTIDFAGIDGGLLKLKLNQLKNFEQVEEIVISSNDPLCLEIAAKAALENKKIKIFKRPENLGSSATNLEDLIRYVPTIVTGDQILWTHVTSPFCGKKQYAEAIKIYSESTDNGFDSLISGHDYKDFLIDKDSKKIINNTSNLKWPSTQDLQDLFQINNAIFICSRNHMINGNRVGDNPLLMKMNKIESIDIDNLEDFKLAELIYGKFFK